ncbi:ABC transporter permease [Jatrophihabitans endophyticus]|uniref:ABC transporter permease n=1 Tax=Jatrophihabitans endophyticus TaxID=1206085 RepID=UPI000934DF93|nr:ABC transporter permease [Jatrophihabitans endophyticus]
MATPAAEPADRVRDNPWVRFALRRTVRLVASVWVLVTASFAMIHLVPGDPVRAALGPTAPAALVRARRHQLGLDEPLAVQYGRYLNGLLHGRMGTSTGKGLPVSQVIGDRLGATLALAVLAFLLAVVLAVPIGVVAGVLTGHGRRRRTELAFTTGSVVVASIPDFVLGVVLVYVFGIRLGWLPVGERVGASSYVLPVISLAVGPAAILARIVRVEMVGVLGADYVRTARAKRLSRARVYLRHALPNALTASLTLAGLLLSAMVAGTVLVESVFNWHGIGQTIVESILNKDYPLVQGIVLVYGLGVLLVNTVVDVALALLDPRSTIRDS